MIVDFSSKTFDLSLTSNDRDDYNKLKTQLTLQSNASSDSQRSLIDSRDPNSEVMEEHLRGDRSHHERCSRDETVGGASSFHSSNNLFKNKSSRKTCGLSSNSLKGIISPTERTPLKERRLSASHSPTETIRREKVKYIGSPLMSNIMLFAKKDANNKSAANTNNLAENNVVSGVPSECCSILRSQEWYMSDSNEYYQIKTLPEFPNRIQQQNSFLKTGHESVVRTSEQDATGWQLEIPSLSEVQAANKLCHFINTYSLSECAVDLSDIVGFTRHELKLFADVKGTKRSLLKPYHQSVVEHLLEYGVDFAQVSGHVRLAATITTRSRKENMNSDEVHEILIVERQRQFTCIVQGTTQEKHNKINFIKSPTQSKMRKVSYSESGDCVQISNEHYAIFAGMQTQLFLLLDSLTDQNPFYDVVFTGHGYAANIANIAAFAYANARPMIRVRSIGFNVTEKSGAEDYRRAVHSSPNLNVIRAEIGTISLSYSTKQLEHVGHLIVIDRCFSQSPIDTLRKSPNHLPESAKGTNMKQQSVHVKGYKFGNLARTKLCIRPATMMKKCKGTTGDYFDSLASLSDDSWLKTFEEQSGPGIPGANGESRRIA